MPDIKNEHGFTLIELLVVSILLALMAGILYGTLNGILQARAIVEQERDAARVAQFVIERMTRELTARVITQLSEQSQGNNMQSNTGSGIFGQKPVMLGLDKKHGKQNADHIRFVSSNTAQQFYRKIPNYGLVEIEYRLESPKDASYRDNPKDGFENMLLVRMEMPAGIHNDEILKKRRSSFPMAENVVGLNFRYMKDGEWLDSWTGQGRRIPEAVEISLRIRSAEQRIDTYRTAVAISRPRRH